MTNEKEALMLGTVIRTTRTMAGLTLRACAKHVGISPSYLSDIENGRRIPAENVLGKIADVLRMDIDMLMAMGGRLGKRVKYYMRCNPTAIVLLRKLAEVNAPVSILQEIIKRLEEAR